MSKELGQGSVGRFFCSTWCQLEWLNGIQLVAGLVWSVQEGFIPGLLPWCGWLEGWPLFLSMCSEPFLWTLQWCDEIYDAEAQVLRASVPSDKRWKLFVSKPVPANWNSTTEFYELSHSQSQHPIEGKVPCPLLNRRCIKEFAAIIHLLQEVIKWKQQLLANISEVFKSERDRESRERGKS